MRRIKVLVVDDSVVVRRLVSDVLAGDPQLDVVGSAVNGSVALAKVAQLSPDLVTMDIEMPQMDGIAAVRALRASGCRVPIVMFSTLTERGARSTLDALAAGASDYVTKPANVGSVAQSMEEVRRQLIPKIKALVPLGGSGGEVARARSTPPSVAAAPPGHAPTLPTPRGPVRPAVTLAVRRPRDTPFQVLAVGCSTGGPEALSAFLRSLPGDLSVPVVVVQHMPPLFTAQFAARLNRLLPFTVAEAGNGQPLLAGTVYLAAGDRHLEVEGSTRGARTRSHQGPPEHFCRPAVDVLFRSLTRVYGGDVLAVVLTGMGTDGRIGSEQVVAAGGSVLVQDEATSVVWGMPGAVAAAGAAEAVLPLNELGPAVVQLLLSAAGDPSGPEPSPAAASSAVASRAVRTQVRP